MVHLVNKDVEEVSQLVLSPLYPRDEVSRKGSLLVNSQMLQLSGLVKSVGENGIMMQGDYVHSRMAFQYGDVLTDGMVHSL
jgi:hypothetical protein